MFLREVPSSYFIETDPYFFPSYKTSFTYSDNDVDPKDDVEEEKYDEQPYDGVAVIESNL